MGMIDQLLANLYPVKQDKNAPLSGKQAAQAIKTQALSHLMPQTGATVTQGQLLTGEVLDLRAGQVLVLLENGATVSARTEGTLQLAIGENARFLVSQTKEDQVILKHIPEAEGTEHPLADKALTAAGITRTEKSISIVTELFAHSQPVTATNIRHYLSLSTKYPELPVKDIILMELSGLPVNEETVSGFSDYLHGGRTLLARAGELVTGLSARLNALPEGKTKQMLTEEFLRILSTNPSDTDSLPLTQHISDAMQDVVVPVTPDSPAGTLQNDIPAAPMIPTDSMTPAAPAEGSTLPAQAADIPATPLPDLPDFFLLAPEEVADSDRITEYYRELDRRLAELEQLAVKLAEQEESPPSNTPKQMRDTLSFLDAVGQAFPYLQLPLKFKEHPAHGELYVYERKRALQPTDTLNALLHLDMEALGTMDVFLTLAGTTVTSRFVMTKTDSADLIRHELPSLSEALAKRGYSFAGDVSVAEPKDKEDVPPLLEQFLKECAPDGAKRYTFDIRA